MKKWQPTPIPDKNNCPGEYCFFFLAPGDMYAQGLHANVEEALKHAKPI